LPIWSFGHQGMYSYYTSYNRSFSIKTPYLFIKVIALQCFKTVWATVSSSHDCWEWDPYRTILYSFVRVLDRRRATDWRDLLSIGCHGCIWIFSFGVALLVRCVSPQLCHWTKQLKKLKKDRAKANSLYLQSRRENKRWNWDKGKSFKMVRYLVPSMALWLSHTALYLHGRSYTKLFRVPFS